MILVDKIASDFGKIYILKSILTGAYAYWQGDCCQSEIDKNGISLAPYIHAIYDLIRQSEVHDVLMIGCGGGTLGTLLKRAGHNVTIVDIDPKSIGIAKRYFKLPNDIHCKIDDGLNFLRNTKNHYDAIVVDAFVNGQIPAHLRSINFFRLAQAKLFESGHLYLNIILDDDSDPSANQIAKLLTEIQLQVEILDTKGPIGRNAVVVAGHTMNFVLPTVTVPPAVMQQKLKKELGKMRFYPWQELDVPGRHAPVGLFT